MELSGTLIRNINQLPLSNKAMLIAKELDVQIDMPVVYWTDYPGKRNDTARMPYKHNQYWVTVKPQTEQKEFDRIVLHNLLRGLMNTRRCHSLIIDDDYLYIHKQEEQKKLVHLCKHINAFATTEICRLFFNKRGIYASARTRRIKFEGLAKQTAIFNNIDRFEKEDLLSSIPILLFSLDLSVYAYLNTKFRQKIPYVLSKIRSETISERIKKYVEDIVLLLRENEDHYSDDKIDNALVFLFNGICSVFDLPNSFHTETFYDYYADESVSVKGIEQLYSFVPEDIDNSLFYVKCVKSINTILCIIQEGLDTFEHKPILDFHINIADSKKIEAYADGNDTDGYFITITKAFLDKVKGFSETCELPEDVPDCTEVYGITIRERIFKCMLFAAVLHEYAHFLNGDCDNKNDLTKPEREKRADKISKQLFLKYGVFQYNCIPSGNPEEESQRIISNLILDRSALEFSLNTLHSWRRADC